MFEWFTGKQRRAQEQQALNRVADFATRSLALVTEESARSREALETAFTRTLEELRALADTSIRSLNRAMTAIIVDKAAAKDPLVGRTAAQGLAFPEMPSEPQSPETVDLTSLAFGADTTEEDLDQIDHCLGDLPKGATPVSGSVSRDHLDPGDEVVVGPEQ